MIFMISYIGYDIKALFTNPVRTAIVVVIIFLLWLVGKYFERRLTIKVEADFRAVATRNDKK